MANEREGQELGNLFACWKIGVWLGKQHRGQPSLVARKKGEFRPISGEEGRGGRRRARRNRIYHRGTECAEDSDLIILDFFAQYVGVFEGEKVPVF